MPIICTLINSATLIYGGVVDYKKREIPNLVPVVLLATGIMSGAFIVSRLLLMLCVAFILWLAGKITKQGLPGGDFKLLCALTFSTGLPTLLGVLFCVGLGAILMGAVKREPMKRNIPLCTYVAPAYLVMSAYLLI